ncbi:DUF1206 domain-containing protein [Nocardioides kribbensis]|uniref:DUF1206 domain-containing protein n=1 Tax=Nocardioides kribbensis TaxID=305517 RepID=UPI001879D664|nr:DUF1206 domain-containing protein [Nocardioides kribbensis]
MGEMTRKAGDATDRAESSDWLDHAVRAGLVAYGVVHLMIAWIALQLALGDQSGSASSTGALQQLTDEPFGKLAIWLIAIGMLLLVVWRVLEAVGGHRGEEGKDLWLKRASSVLKGVIYAVIGWSAVQVATGSGSKGGSDDTTATVMNMSGGQFMVGLAGVLVIAYGVGQIVRAWTEKFREHLTAEGKSGEAGTAYIWFGKAGYAAKGVAIGIVGGLFLYAAYTHQAKKSGGLDQALHKVLQQPYGPVMLGVIAVGIGCYGLFCFARARHLSR